MRLDKFIVSCGASTRTEVKKLIKQGRISVDDMTAKKSDMQVNEDVSIVCLDGTKLEYREFVYLMLNKPAGYISATYDAHQKTVVDLIPKEYLHFAPFPVGRLDIDTEGLLILTNDGKLAHELTSPKKHVYKTYYAKLDSPAERKDVEIFKEGIKLDDDFTTLPAELRICEDPNDVYVMIREGKFHQVKRMCESVGKKVVYLERIQMGALELDPKLPRGCVREILQEELKMLTKL